MKRIFSVIVAIFATMTLTGCAYNIIDTTYNFNYAYVELPNGDVIEGTVTSWKDYEDGDQLQVTIDGITYLSNSTRIVLIYK